MSKRVLFQGDSITDCHRIREAEHCRGCGYATMVSGALSYAEPYAYEFINRGVSGDRIVDVYARMKRDIINLHPDYMSILIGINDVWHEYTDHNGVSANKFELVYDLLIQELMEALPNLKIMILEPFVLPGSATCATEECPDRWTFFEHETKLRAEAARRIAVKHNLAFVPLMEAFQRVNVDAPTDDYWLVDGVHPNSAGHELIKQAWLQAFEGIK